MSPRALRRIAATLLVATLPAFSAAPPAHAVLDGPGRATAIAGRDPGRGIIAFLLRLILKTNGSGDTTTTTTTPTTTTSTTTRQTAAQDAGGAMDPNG